MRKLFFKTHAHLKNVLGQELINDDNVAVQELVKNSYDAGSKKVEVIFKNLKKNEDMLLNKTNFDKHIKNSSKLLIIDEGEGMNEDDIQNKWLNIAYSSKRLKKKSNKRMVAGAKGVGRFSCDRLGEFLDLYTKTKNMDKIIHLRIKWNEFEKKQDINDIIQNISVSLEEPLTSNQLMKKIGCTIKNCGTILEISKLREDWIEREDDEFYYDKIVSLKKALEKLTNPNQQIEKDSFKIFLRIEDLSKNDYDKEDEEYKYLKKNLVENKIFSKLSFKVTEIISEISKDGKDICTILKDRDRTIFELREKNNFSQLKNVKIHLYFLNQYAKAYFKRQTGIRSVEFGNLFLFINGFRVPPYGEYMNDWLGLDIRAKQRYASLLGTRDVIGRIEIFDEDNRFQIVSNREGIVRNRAFNQLVGLTRLKFVESYIYSVFRKLELFVIEGLDWDKVQDKDDAREYTSQIESGQIKYDPKKEKFEKSQHERDIKILEEIKKIVGITTKKPDIKQLVINTDILDEIQEEELEKADKILRDVESFDTKMDVKTSKGINKIKKTINALSLKARKEEKQRKEAEKERDQAKEETKYEKQKREETEKRELFVKSLLGKPTEEIQKLQHQIKISSNNISDAMLYLKGSFIDKERTPSPKILKDIVSNVLLESDKIRKITSIVTSANFDLYSKKIKEDIVNFIREYVEGFKQSFINTTIDGDDFGFKVPFSPLEIQIILDNLYNNAEKSGAKNITLIFKKLSKNELEIKFLDDGKKAKEENISDMFKFGFTTTKGGSGMGLYNVNQIIKSMNSKVNFIQNDTEKGMKIVIKK